MHVSVPVYVSVQVYRKRVCLKKQRAMQASSWCVRVVVSEFSRGLHASYSGTSVTQHYWPASNPPLLFQRRDFNISVSDTDPETSPGHGVGRIVMGDKVCVCFKQFSPCLSSVYYNPGNDSNET